MKRQQYLQLKERLKQKKKARLSSLATSPEPTFASQPGAVLEKFPYHLINIIVM
jgi:hypothetical protein